MRDRHLRPRLLRRLIRPLRGLLHDNRRDLGGLRRRGHQCHGRDDGIRSGRRQRGRRVDDATSLGDERRALGGRQLWVPRGHDGCAQVLGESLGDQRNASTAADGGYRRDACRGHAVALESFVKRRKEFRERRLHQVLEFGARDADIVAVAGEIGRDGRRDLCRQSFLGAPSIVAQPHQ
jgi:hypothetical protein